jgi:hypothetical protein
MKRILCGLLSLSLGCVEPEDVPSNVSDLRVLGVRLDPPELMAQKCTEDIQALTSTYAQEVHYTALIADPTGGGRSIESELLACASTEDRVCDTPGERYELAPLQEISSGELSIPLGALGALGFPEDPLLRKVLEEDPYGGLGGLRVPLVLHLRAGGEEIYAQKLMVYSCRFVPDQTQNTNPELPGVRLNGLTWAAAEVPLLEGLGPFPMDPEPFEDLQESYVVPSFQLERVELRESWKIAWYADYGRFVPEETGGMDFGGGNPRHQVEWSPPGDATERDVRFWVVVRDGRGGSSWVTRIAHYRP